MKISKLSTITLSGLFLLGLGACDAVDSGPDSEKEAQEAEAEADVDDDADADADADAQADEEVIAGPGDAARELAEKQDNYCAFAVGECLSRTKQCNKIGGENCNDAFAQCRDEHVSQHCELGKLVAGVKATLGCWEKFGGCSAKNGGGEGCLAGLQECITEAAGCEESGGCGEISWPKGADSNWPVSETIAMEEVRAYPRYRPGYYRDRYGRIWYLDRYGRWYRVGGGGGWPGGGGGGGGGWPGGGGGGG